MKKLIHNKPAFILLCLLMGTIIGLAIAQPTGWNINARPTSDWFSGADTPLNVPLQWMRETEKLISGTVFGKIYFCDANHGVDTRDGLSWASSVKTLTKAMLLASTYIGSGGHATERCVIYYTNDGEAETLTTLARETDIIGVGCGDGFKGARIKGNHTIMAAADPNIFTGCRLFNIAFDAAAGSTHIMQIPTGHHGIEFHNCHFEPFADASNTYGIQATGTHDLVIQGCRFMRENGSNNGFTTAAIDIGNAGIIDLDIGHNWIDAEIGIVVYSGIASNSCSIHDNFIHATTLTIDENSDTMWIYGNRLISEADYSAGGTGSHDFALAQAVDNMINGNGKCQWIPDPNDMDIRS